MFNNIYIVKVQNKQIYTKLIKYHIYFLDVIKKNDYYLIYVDYYNYNKLLKYKTILSLELVSIRGINRYKYLLKKYVLFFITFLVGIGYLYFLSNIIFEVKIVTNDQEIYRILDNELKYHGISKYHFIKSFNDKEVIKEGILNDNRNTLEWLEIDRVGSIYNIYVERRIINNSVENIVPTDVVARKNAIVLEIKAINGNIVKKVNDFVNKGDVIVSGNIFKGDNIVNQVEANATVYGETWYTVKVELPLNYYDKTYTGKQKKKITINFFNKRIKLFNLGNYNNEEVSSKIIFFNNLLPISLSYDTYREIEVINDIYTNDKALEIGINLARDKLLTTLDKSSKIMSQKKLKLYENDSRIILVVFFRVYEDITDYREINTKVGE